MAWPLISDHYFSRSAPLKRPEITRIARVAWGRGIACQRANDLEDLQQSSTAVITVQLTRWWRCMLTLPRSAKCSVQYPCSTSALPPNQAALAGGPAGRQKSRATPGRVWRLPSARLPLPGWPYGLHGNPRGVTSWVNRVNGGKRGFAVSRNIWRQVAGTLAIGSF
jgi:hypothetical protein